MRFFMIVAGVLCAATLALWTPTADAVPKVDIFVYTEITQWIGQGQAQEQADIFIKEVEGQRGIGKVVNENAKAIEKWTKDHTEEKGYHLISLYGDFPPEIYPQGNKDEDGSVAEEFLDAGNTFSNSADYFFWGLAGRNREGGLQNMMDIPGIVQWDDDTAMKVTKEGKEFTPTLKDYATDRPFHVDQLEDDWEVEIAFATETGKSSGMNRCDPCIIRNTKTDARLIQVYQTNGQDDPKGKVLSEIILNYYLEVIGALDVDPQEKLSTTWGDLKSRR